MKDYRKILLQLLDAAFRVSVDRGERCLYSGLIDDTRIGGSWGLGLDELERDLLEVIDEDEAGKA